nr:GerAB/ArcD/ProY family transporter [Fictibacillus gelatini]
MLRFRGFSDRNGDLLFRDHLYLPLAFIENISIDRIPYLNLRPLFDHPFSSYLTAAKAMALEYLGFETLLMYYPFLKTPEKAIKWAHFGNLFSILIYLLTAITTFLYYNEEELARTIWATLTLWKIVDFPFMERFEYAGIALWLFAVLPNICLALWATSRGMKQLFHFNQRYSLICIIIAAAFACSFIEGRPNIDWLNTITSTAGFYTVYFYIPALFVVQWIIYKVRKKKS